MSSKELALRNRLDDIGTALDKAVAVLKLLTEQAFREAKLAQEQKEYFAIQYQNVYDPVLWTCFGLIRDAAAMANDQEVGI